MVNGEIADKEVINGSSLDIAYNGNLHAKRAVDVCLSTVSMRGTVFGTSSFLVNWSLSNFSNLCFSGRIRLTNGFLLINVVYMKGCMILSQNFVISRYSLKKYL